MNNNNNQNQNTNGKEVLKGQITDNGQKEGNTNPANRIKKKNKSSENKIHPVESKKIPITVNKNPSNVNKNASKEQVSKLEENVSKKIIVRSDIKKPIRPVASEPVEERAHYNDTSTFESPQSEKIEKKNYKLSANGGRLLLLVAILLFIAWAVIFFYYKTGGNVHMLLALAVICGIISLLGRKRS